ncbi:MAG: pyridoxamine 5'-phosphate oxidase family protein [Clostridia bacterium]|nr:pyridoxamine 5'-phosphate oxidase family protein [Clostridia bacterium]
MRDIQKTVGLIADKQKKCFLSYIDEDGFPQIRAMLSPRERDGVKVFYLSTNTSSKKIGCFLKNPKASLYFVDQRFYNAVCLSGTVEVLQDEDTKKRIWRLGDKMYYSKGVNDPDYCVLKFTAEKGRRYSNFKNEDFLMEEN